MSLRQHGASCLLAGIAAAALTSCASTPSAATAAVDPGVRAGPPGAGVALPGLSADEMALFQDGLARFVQVETVAGGRNNGLGARFNATSCLSCHAQPGIGGSSPAANPSIAIATLHGARNVVPWFIAKDGPVREARFKRNPDGSNDGGVHNLYVITGRDDAAGCRLAQPNFLPAGQPLSGQGGNPNVVFRVPTPVFGAGLIESIADAAILANMRADSQLKTPMGILGHPNAHLSGNANHSANDGTITRFGWKAQNKSLLLFAGEAYNVEMGVTNQLFPQERDETPGCLINPTPEDTLNFTASAAPNATAGTAVLSDIEAFANFMRLLAPPTPAPDSPSIVRGRAVFAKIGCAYCHTPSFTTGKAIASGTAAGRSAALSNQPVNLYSDLLVHHMGAALADGITQGGAGPDEFRTAPLWGLGQRIFFLHDGRSKDLLKAIAAHRSAGSEATKVINLYDRLSVREQQDILDFLRAL